MGHYGELISRASLGPINIGLRSAREDTMISLLGRPTGPLDSKACYNKQASQMVKQLLITRQLDHMTLHGIRPAVDSLVGIFAKVKAEKPNLYPVVNHAGMLCVRMRRPVNGGVSQKLSNHSWGTAIDITIEGKADTNPDGKVQRGLAELIPYFNAAGWYSGVGFNDDTHFEVADETMQRWAMAGELTPEAVPVG